MADKIKNDMNLLMENWRLYEQEMLLEQEFEQFFNEHFLSIEEGFVDWAIDKGREVKDTVINVIDGMKDWTHEKIVKFVKFMGDKFRQFIAKLKEKGVFKKYRARAETKAIDLLMTNKHIDLAVMIFTTLAKITSGFVSETPEVIKKILELLENPISTFKEMVGDATELVDMIKKFIDFRKDREDLKKSIPNWDDFGGLAELLTPDTPRQT